MITKMKKLTFLVYHKEYEMFLERIRELGVVHVVEKQWGEMDDSLQLILRKQTLYKGVLQSMFLLADKQPDEHVHSELAPDALVQQYEDLKNRIQNLNQQASVLDKEIDQMEVWGDFDWEVVRKLEAAGWHVQFYACPKKDYDTAWEEEHNAIIVGDDGNLIRFVTVTCSPVALDIDPLRLPARNLSELKAGKAENEKALRQADEDLKQFCKANYATLKEGESKLYGEIDWMKVKLSSEEVAEGAVALLEGWVPADQEEELKKYLDESCVYYESRNATREDDVPVKLKNNAFTRMYEVLTKMYGMPSFTDFDPTPIVAPFFSLFFAFCMGDAGYGLILILLGFLLKKKLGKEMAGMMNLVITLGIFTTVFGAFLGTFFGMSLIDSDLPQNLKNFIIAGNVELFGSTYDKQMILALGIGVVHISIAMTVKAINSTVFYGFKESLSAWGWWLFIVGGVVVGTLSFLSIIPAEVSKWAFIAVAGVGAVGIYLLNNLRRNVLVNIGAGLWDTYNMASGLLGDTLSYIRLFALGLAGGMLGQTFNNLALMVVDGTEGVSAVFGWIGFGLIILVGHTLNIAMSCLSAFVHPLRLTFVEYFKNAGYQGKGLQYKPFKK
ncbi:V-type ATPase 116kDa subunit family protein [uncultured Bacteroides sp.]|uniref:V-type ATP synthase subunit I n=1 Tax=uncultured Bacteroides sp. TaxID=162156 RepID=UPI0026763334|nr:V-type ATPase 116kDa subunit family protein [uncultured Bacteroides sp.]